MNNTSFSPRRHSVSQVFVFVLLGIFAVLSTFMVLLSAQMYRGVINHTEEHSARRILTSYVANVVRSNDAAGMVSVEKRGDIDVLVLGYDADGDKYETAIYCYEGSLCELFAQAEQEFEPSYGEVICEAQMFVPQIEKGLLSVTLTDASGEDAVISIALRSSQEAGNE